MTKPRYYIEDPNYYTLKNSSTSIHKLCGRTCYYYSSIFKEWKTSPFTCDRDLKQWDFIEITEAEAMLEML
jgi:hypothetical protein